MVGRRQRCRSGRGGLLPLVCNRCSRVVGAVVLETDAVLEEVVSRALVHAGQEGAHHHAAGSDGQGFDDAAGVLDAAVGDHRHAVAPGHASTGVDGGKLCASGSFDELCGGDGASAHAHTQSIRTGF